MLVGSEAAKAARDVQSELYEDAMGKIRTGDIVFVTGATGMLSWLITSIGRTSFSHVGIACWMYDLSSAKPTLFIIEAAPSGRRLVSMSHYGLKRPMTVVASPVDWSMYSRQLLDGTGDEPYGYLDLIRIALAEMFGIRTRDFDGEVCSEMVATVLNEAGFPIDDTPSPGQLYRTLIERGCVIRLTTSPK